ncbi:hypothetical protein ACGF5F_01065 [Streptomyces sp. NPDC047821]|uniref:hypothetical protein n=1 Tax=Streptomyces sp. NPDC047821 TaxID=3365488 RepID=UPI00371F7869
MTLYTVGEGAGDVPAGGGGGGGGATVLTGGGTGSDGTPPLFSFRRPSLRSVGGTGLALTLAAYMAGWIPDGTPSTVTAGAVAVTAVGVFLGRSVYRPRG